MERWLKVVSPAFTKFRDNDIDVAEADAGDGALFEPGHVIHDGQGGFQALREAAIPIVLCGGQDEHILGNNHAPGFILGAEFLVPDRREDWRLPGLEMDPLDGGARILGEPDLPQPILDLREELRHFPDPAEPDLAQDQG